MENHSTIQVKHFGKGGKLWKKGIIEYTPKAKAKVIDVWRNITVAELAQVLDRDVKYVCDLFLNQVSGGRTVISDQALLHEAVKRSGHRMRVVANPNDVVEEEVDRDIYPRPPPTKSQLKPRPPVVTVMGHVDHGKTTLLDALRNTKVVASEFGGITQHIGAFSVELKSGAKITFLDTPGHAAFTAMRERGANITDIVVLVVAADDGVMEQTVESIRMARQARVPILVAINKIDAPRANVEETKQMLVNNGIQVESLGGDVQAVPISALKRRNLDQLTEALVLQAELLEVGADPIGPVEAVVVESRLHPQRGRLCTIVVQRGTLKKGDVIVADTSLCRVRSIKDHDGKQLTEVKPGYPAEVEGWKDLPSAGEVVLQVDSEKTARNVIKARESKKQLAKQEEDAIAISSKEEQHDREYKEKLMHKRRMGRFRLRSQGPRGKEIIDDDDGTPRINLIIKADVDGTLEALLNTLDSYEEPDCVMDLVHYGVGAVTESDIEMAKSFNGIIYAFNSDCPPKCKDLADQNSVPIKHHNVIYKLVDDVKEEINDRLPPISYEEVIGEATVLQQFDINEGRKKVPVAGSRCIKGVLKRSAKFKLVRNEETLFDGPLSSMRHLKNEVDSIKKDLDCGLQLQDKDLEFKPGDTIVCYENKSKRQETSWDPGF
ncbi:PREDICTED: translation initiation factor IF-2, mitochondrial isoform X2 [Nicrophorus vespilloides]|uniref:Translation initiation factor IF-2, mitochondrial isoform X2 n=1 Tax=Nicrophorus vespilloides TaxID=110193 RepID=A0ABM1MQI9_NICVS|nr:PREDICTED: translation initiation factor IF-2, mitochondrial isoform X2 [Nicrophorus vespilloides]